MPVLSLGNKPPKEVSKTSGQNGLVKEGCIIKDATAAGTIHIWDDLLSKLTTGNSYKFTNLTVKNYSGMALLGTAPTKYIETDLKFNCTKGPELLSNTERELTIAEFNFVDKVNIYMTCQIKSCQKKCHMLWAQQF